MISQLTKAKPHESVIDWLSRTDPKELYLSVVSLMEVRYGIETMPAGRKRRDFTTWLENDLPRMFASRLLPIDHVIADEAARMLSLMQANSRRPDVADALLAATARVRGLKLATLNYKDFEFLRVELVDL